MSSNNFKGTLPSNLGSSLKNLKSLYLDHNLFTGPFPTSLTKLFNATGLRKMDVSFNYLNGTQPKVTGGGVYFNFSLNCFSNAANQRSAAACAYFYAHGEPLPPSPPPPPPPPPCTTIYDCYPWGYQQPYSNDPDCATLGCFNGVCGFTYNPREIYCYNAGADPYGNEPAKQGCTRPGCKDGLCQYLPDKDGTQCRRPDPNACHNNTCLGGACASKNAAPGSACTVNASSVDPTWNTACYQGSCSSTGNCTQFTFSSSSTICRTRGLRYPACKTSHCSGVDGTCKTTLYNSPDGTICTAGSSTRECQQNFCKSGACTGLMNKTDHTPCQTMDTDFPPNLLGPDYPYSHEGVQDGQYDNECRWSYYPKGTFCGTRYECGIIQLFQCCPACDGQGSCTVAGSDGQSCKMCNGYIGYYDCIDDHTCDYNGCTCSGGSCFYNA
eukprot:SM000457S16452  [mRNA]  locus=s457:7438:10965:+ [translate_table: standard]